MAAVLSAVVSCHQPETAWSSIVLLAMVMQIMEMVRPAAAVRGLETPAELWAFFVKQCQQNLHVVLTFSAIGGAFRERLRTNPSLVNCCTIDWYHAWPKDALEAVAAKFLADTDLLVCCLHCRYALLHVHHYVSMPLSSRSVPVAMRPSTMFWQQTIEFELSTVCCPTLKPCPFHIHEPCFCAITAVSFATSSIGCHLPCNAFHDREASHPQHEGRMVQEKDQRVIVPLCQQFHKVVQGATASFAVELGRRTYVTPTSYLELITLFQSLLTKKRSENAQLCSRYTVGLKKLVASGAAVAAMQAELSALQPQLVQTVAEVKALMAQIAADKRDVVEPKAAVCSLFFLLLLFRFLSPLSAAHRRDQEARCFRSCDGRHAGGALRPATPARAHSC